MTALTAIVLAAGKGTRMKSDLPKVFHPILGEPMLSYVLKTVAKLKPQKTIVVVGHKKDLIIDYYKDWPLEFVVQAEQLGTGHAVMQAEEKLKGIGGNVLVLAGDVPMIGEQTLKSLVDFHQKNHAAATDLTAELDDAGSYGRIVRDKAGQVLRIVEKKDATPEELKIKEFNTGTFCFNKEALFSALKEVKAENVQKEYYLTDTLEIMRRQGLPIFAYKTPNYQETLGINTVAELLQMEQLISHA